MSGLNYVGWPPTSVQGSQYQITAARKPGIWTGQKPDDENIARINRQSSWRRNDGSPQNLVQSPQRQQSPPGQSVAWNFKDEPLNGMTEEEKLRWHRLRKESYIKSQQGSGQPPTGQPSMKSQSTQTSRPLTPQQVVTLNILGPDSRSATDYILDESAFNYANMSSGQPVKRAEPESSKLGNTYTTNPVLHPVVKQATYPCICKDGDRRLLTRAERILCIPSGDRGNGHVRSSMGRRDGS